MYELRRRALYPIPADKPHLKGVGVALMSMNSGERSLLHIDWRYAYGPEGNFSFPHVPPQSNMIMDVELLGFELEEDVSLRMSRYVWFLAHIRCQLHNTLVPVRQAYIHRHMWMYELLGHTLFP